MYFQFPEKVSSISVERQVFQPEFTDEEGNRFFRAPDHFADQIMSLNLGFKPVPRPEGAPDDLPSSAVTDVVSTLSAETAALQEENKNLRQMLNDASAERDQVVLENKALKAKIEELQKPAEKDEKKK